MYHVFVSTVSAWNKWSNNDKRLQDLAEKDSDGAPNQIEDKFQSDEDVVQDDSEYETEDVEDDYSTDMSNSVFTSLFLWTMRWPHFTCSLTTCLSECNT